MKFNLNLRRENKTNKYVEKILNQIIPPLSPYKLVDEYGDFINDKIQNVVRVNCLWGYLEGVIDLLFVFYVETAFFLLNYLVKEGVLRLFGETEDDYY